MGEFCNLVTSERGHDKLVCRGYLYTRRAVKARKDNKLAHYWRCENRECNASAVTIVIEGRHKLEKFAEHGHAAEAARAGVSEIKHAIKRRAEETAEPAGQIIQEIKANTNPEILPYLPSTAALKQSIKRKKQNENIEPQTLDALNLPNEYKYTLNNELFLIREKEVDSDKILVFSTVPNLKKLSEAAWWIMDGIFDVVPNIFYQLYTIHAPVGPPERHRSLPLVYALMTSKSMKCYDMLFDSLIEYCEEHDIELDPSNIITDLERAPLTSTSKKFPGVTNGTCLFHVGQCIYRQIQKSGLTEKYGEDERFSIIIRQMIALAFLPPDEIPDAWEELKKLIPNAAKDVKNWFDTNYVRGKYVRKLRGKEKRTPPLYPPKLWSIHERMEDNLPRTQNHIEAWHRRFRSLVGKSHVGVYTIIDELKKEQQSVEGDIENITRGEPRPATKRKDRLREERIRTIFNERQHYDNVLDWLRGLAHNIKV